MIDVFPFAGFPVAVFGLGRSGIATALALQESDAEVWAWDGFYRGTLVLAVSRSTIWVQSRAVAVKAR